MSSLAEIPLIPRKTFFENPVALNPRLSPDGKWLSWLGTCQRRDERMDRSTLGSDGRACDYTPSPIGRSQSTGLREQTRMFFI